jgi:hypothetical protein
MLSRRKLITAGAAAGAVSLFPSPIIEAAAGGQVQGSQSASVSDYLTVMAPTDPNFGFKLDQLFPGLSSDPIFQKIQTHAVLVTNVSKKKIRAYSTYWTVTTPTGAYETPLRHFFHPSSNRKRSAHFGKKGNKTRFTGKVAAIKPGATRLVTPYFNWGPFKYKNHPKPKWEKIITEKTSRQFFLYELSKATSVEVTIDAVVLNRHKIIGPDRASLGKRYGLIRNAEHDEALSVHQLLVKGASLDEVATHLKKQLSVPLPPRSHQFRYLYRAVRRRQAHLLLRRLYLGGPEKFVKTVDYLRKKHRTVFKKPTLG